MHDPPSAPPVRVVGPALVLLLGPGADAAARAFRPGEVLAEDGDPAARLDRGELTVVPLERADPAAVRRLVAAAREADRPVDAVLLGGPPPGFARSCFRAVATATGAGLVVDRLPAAFDHRDRTGPFDVIGDVHGCLDELLLLLARLGYAVRRDATGRPDGAHHPGGRTAVFTGDLVDRGPDVSGVLRLVLGMLADRDALAVTGNHDDVLRGVLLGRDVPWVAGLEVSLRQLEAEPPEFRQAVVHALGGLPDHLLLDGGRLVVAHAGLPERYHGRESALVRSLCLHGPTSGATDEHGLPDRLPWADDYRGAATVVYGHTPTADPQWRNGTICIDGGCVFGGALVAVRYPECTLVSVAALAAHSAPARPFLPAT